MLKKYFFYEQRKMHFHIVSDNEALFYPRHKTIIQSNKCFFSVREGGGKGLTTKNFLSSIKAILRIKTKVYFATKLEGEGEGLSGRATKKNLFFRLPLFGIDCIYLYIPANFPYVPI